MVEGEESFRNPAGKAGDITSGSRQNNLTRDWQTGVQLRHVVLAKRERPCVTLELLVLLPTSDKGLLCFMDSKGHIWVLIKRPWQQSSMV